MADFVSQGLVHSLLNGANSTHPMSGVQAQPSLDDESPVQVSFHYHTSMSSTRNSLTRLICYVGAAASVLTFSIAWLVYAAVAVVALAVAGAAVFSAPAPCRRPTTVNFSMNPPR